MQTGLTFECRVQHPFRTDKAASKNAVPSMRESAEKVLHFLFQPHSGCKNIHDIGTPLQLPGKLFPQDIVTAAALEKPLVVFHGKIH